MRLAAIYNVWDAIELLSGSLRCIRNDVDIVIIIWQRTSNFGEVYNPEPEIHNALRDNPGLNKILIEYKPRAVDGFSNEINKRNLGLEYAWQDGCTHFLHMDVDEYYEDFGAAKKLYREMEPDHGDGSVCKLFTYIRRPEFRCDEPDGYYVPFIHALTPFTRAGEREYPFHADPTRRINTSNVFELPVFMHHFSYIRANIQRKVKNSSARNNILKGSILQNWEELGKIDDPTGYYIQDWDRKLVKVPNIFDIKV